MTAIERAIDDAKRHLVETRGVCGSGTIACRLWHALRAMILACEKEQEEKKAMSKTRTRSAKALIATVDKLLPEVGR